MLSTRRFEAAKFLTNQETMTAYLAAALEEGEADVIRTALSDVVSARGVADIAKETGLTREAIYKALGDKGNPTLTTLLAVTKALGVKLSIAA